MPKRTDLDSILIIGAGPIVIGQACEFDCKAVTRSGSALITSSAAWAAAAMTGGRPTL